MTDAPTTAAPPNPGWVGIMVPLSPTVWFQCEFSSNPAVQDVDMAIRYLNLIREGIETAEADAALIAVRDAGEVS